MIPYVVRQPKPLGSPMAKAFPGRRRRQEAEAPIPTVLEPEFCSREVKRDWSRLIRKVYETDPWVCPRCRNRMRVIASIEDPKVIRRIPERLGLWTLFHLTDPDSVRNKISVS